MFEKLKSFFNNETVIEKPKTVYEDNLSLRKDVTNKMINSDKNNINKIIEEIHETFYTEVDRLLDEAKNYDSLDTDKQTLIDKSNRLKALGFINTKEVKEAELEVARLNKVEKSNRGKSNLISAINYFRFKYPTYKFITEESVKKICDKYNLVYGEIKNYIGTVPDANLKHIEDFKIDEKDCCYSKTGVYSNSFRRFQDETYVSSQEVLKYDNDEYYEKHSNYYFSVDGEREVLIKQTPLEIVAPQKDFDMSGMKVENGKITKIEIPDPIVLKPIFYNNTKHYLVVTMWGDENIPEPHKETLLFNEKLN